MDKKWEDAHKLCRFILMYEPNNSTAREFLPLIERKIELMKKMVKKKRKVRMMTTIMTLIALMKTMTMIVIQTMTMMMMMMIVLIVLMIAKKLITMKTKKIIKNIKFRLKRSRMMTMMMYKSPVHPENQNNF